MLLSKAILEFSKLIDEHGDMEFVTHDLDTGWSFKIEKETSPSTKEFVKFTYRAMHKLKVNLGTTKIRRDS